MAHLFCNNCGTKLEYAHAQPNFCVKCGQALNSNATAEASASPVESKAISDDETDAQHIPSLASIQVEIEADGHNTFTLGSLAGKGTPADYRPRKGSTSVNEFVDEKRE
jgi:hypothetical protein|tara:strand:- start:551 stop:877 length:327 start_codon:yes stop_codon:yes gene_type:complete